MEQYFSMMFEDVRYERSLTIVLSLTDPDIIKQSKFTDHEPNIIKVFGLEIIFRQRIIKEQVAMDLLKKQFSN